VSKITDPAEKKARANREDHRYPAEYPHAFRSSFPRKRARANRKYRRQVGQFLDDTRDLIRDGAEASSPPLRRDVVRKEAVVPLGEWVTERRERRVRRTTWNYFKVPFNPTIHRESFIGFLVQVTAVDTPAARALARYFYDLIDPTDGPPRGPDANVGRKRAWLRAFLADSPEWDKRLHAWMEQACSPDAVMMGNGT
jgi:hypothetical protein